MLHRKSFHANKSSSNSCTVIFSFVDQNLVYTWPISGVRFGSARRGRLGGGTHWNELNQKQQPKQSRCEWKRLPRRARDEWLIDRGECLEGHSVLLPIKGFILCENSSITNDGWFSVSLRSVYRVRYNVMYVHIYLYPFVCRRLKKGVSVAPFVKF